jgi:hypothetical protein
MSIEGNIMADQSTSAGKDSSASAPAAPSPVYFTMTAVDYNGVIIPAFTPVSDSATIAYLQESGQIRNCLRTALTNSGGA